MVVVLDHQSSQTIYVRPKPPTYTHSYKSYVTSAYWAQNFKVHNRNIKRGEKVVKQVVVGKKTCNNKSCRATWAVFYILMGFLWHTTVYVISTNMKPNV